MTKFRPSLTRRVAAGAVFSAVLSANRAAVAQQRALRVFAAGATKSVVEELAPLFERESGVKLDTVFDTVGALRDRALAGDVPDLILLSAVAIRAVAEKRSIPAALKISLGRTGVGLAVPRGRPTPAIDTPERLRDFLTTVGVIGHADPARGATAGTQFRKAVEQLGLQETLREKLRVFPFGVEVIAALGRGEIDAGVSQATEIVTHDKVAFVGFLPDPLQAWTEYEAAALSDSDAARKFLDMMRSSAGAAALKRSGFEAVGK